MALTAQNFPHLLLILLVAKLELNFLIFKLKIFVVPL